MAGLTAAWQTWVTSTGSLTVTLSGGTAIASLYFPAVPVPITVTIAGVATVIAQTSGPQTVPIPTGVLSLTLSASSGQTIYVYATSAIISPIVASTAATSLPASSITTGTFPGTYTFSSPPIMSGAGITAYTIKTTSLTLGLVNVQDYGASPTNTPTANTTAIQNALNVAGAGGADVLFPVGQYLINAALSWPANVRLYGYGYGSCIIAQTNLTADILVAQANVSYLSIVDLSLTYATTGGAPATATAGNAINLLAGTTSQNLKYIYIERVAITNHYNGISINGCLAVWINNCVSSTAALGGDTINIGVQANPSTSQIYQTANVWMRDNSWGTTGTGYGIHLRAVNGVYVTGDNYSNFGYGILVDPTNSNTKVFNCISNGVSWDNSGGTGIQITPTGTIANQVYSFVFVNSWSAGSLGTNINMTGTTAGSISGISYSSHRFWNCTNYGMVIGTGCDSIEVINPICGGVSGSPGNGILVNTGATNVSIKGGRIGPQATYPANSGYGIYVSGSGNSNVSIEGVNVSGNTLGGIFLAAGFGSLRIRGNIGYNDVTNYGGSQAVTSGTAVQNISGIDQVWYSSGGATITAYAVGSTNSNGVATGQTGTGQAVIVPAGYWYTVTAGTVPTVLKFALGTT